MILTLPISLFLTPPHTGLDTSQLILHIYDGLRTYNIMVSDTTVDFAVSSKREEGGLGISSSIDLIRMQIGTTLECQNVKNFQGSFFENF